MARDRMMTDLRRDKPGLEEIFARPPAEYVPVPWWSWTGSLEPEMLRRQLLMMREQGIREFFIFPLYGIEVEYLSEEYLDRVATVCEWCRELGMRVWIYDEHNWPSGMAAGRVARNHPDAIGWAIHPEQSCEPQRDQTHNITAYGSLWCRHEPGVLDLLSRQACRAFIDEAYEPIARRCAEYLGTTLVGFFLDEPTMAPGSIPWTPELPQRFASKFGYDLLPKLSELVHETGDWRQTRVDYWSLVSEMCAEAFTGQIAVWCEERGLMLTGHLSFEEGSGSVWPHGDSPAHLRRMQVPGCDLLGLFTNYDEYAPGFIYSLRIMAPKVASSSARFAGRKRVMCEAFGVAPWSRTLADEKRMTDWMVALGVNFINDNALICDISGFRKRGIGGKHFTQPWWPHAHRLYEYAARLCAMSAETTLDTELAVLYPSTSWWSLALREQPKSEELARLDKELGDALDMLVNRHWDFEFIFEDVLESAEVRDGALVTEHGEFRAIVLAGVSRIGPGAARKIEEFEAAGGVVLRGSADVDALGAALNERVGRPWSVEADGVISSARVAADGRRLLFLANMTPCAKDVCVSWDGGHSIELWDADKGATWRPEQEAGSCRLALPDGESVWVVESARAGTCEGRKVGRCEGVPLEGPWTFASDRPNAYLLQCKLRPEGSEAWITLEDGDAGIALSPDDMEFYWLAVEFELEGAISDLAVVADSAESEEAYLNGEKLGEARQVTVWDEANRAWEIGGRAVAGRNRLLIKVRPSPYHARWMLDFPATTGLLSAPPVKPSIAEPVALRGSFGAWERDGVACLRAMPTQIELGCWRGEGLPHFAGTGIYETSFEWGSDGPAVIECDAGRDVVETLLDGVSLGLKPWGSRRFDVERLAPGRHTLAIRVTNTLGCILRRGYFGQLHPAPASGLVSITIRHAELDSALET